MWQADTPRRSPRPIRKAHRRVPSSSAFNSAFSLRSILVRFLEQGRQQRAVIVGPDAIGQENHALAFRRVEPHLRASAIVCAIVPPDQPAADGLADPYQSL